MLAELQEKARNVLEQSRTGADPSLLHLIEELCRVVEKIKDESKRDRCDLIQQIEAADKKYRTTQKFLEEQAMERELERDEAQKKIDDLYNQLKERDKDKVNSELAASEVNGAYSRCRDTRYAQIEQLEQQLQEKTSNLIASSQKIKDVETERNEAVEKIKVLREIIRDLELQTESKSLEIKEYLEAINKLRNIIAQQEGVDSTRQGDVSNNEDLYKHIEQLENELQTLRLQTELAGNEGVTKQIRTQLYEIENQVDRKTKELETLHSTASTNCSSPSEDLSAREIVLPKSPKKMEDCEVPLQQLARLREKLIRHSRAEDAAMKRIRDLEMQVFGLKQELEETSSEREYLKKQIQEQLVLISDFQIRLDEQRIRADNIEKQTNTSLELKIYDMQNEITSLREKLQQKEKYINNQIVLLTETQERLRHLENEVSCNKDDDLIVEMQKEIDKLRSDNAHMKKKIQNESQMVPNLVENIISDKNHDMERLRLKLDDTEKLLEAYTSLNLDKKDLQTLANIKNNGTNLEELISILDLSQGDQIRRMESRNNSESLMSPGLFIKRRKSDETLMEAELSSIIGPNSANSGIQTRNSTELSHKKVHFEDTQIEHLKNEMSELKNLLDTKDTVIKEYEERLKLLDNLETKIEKLQKSLEDTEKTLAAASETFEREQNELKEKEKELGVQLAEKKLQLEEKEKKLIILERDSIRKDDMCKTLTKEKNSLEKTLTTLKHENFINVDNAIKVKNAELNALRQQLTSMYNSENEKLLKELSEKGEKIERFLNEIDQLTMDLGESQSKNKLLENNLEECSNEIMKLKKELENKNLQIESLTTELSTAKEKLNKRRKIIRELEDTVVSQKSSLQSLYEDQELQKSSMLDKDCTIEILNEDADRYLRDIAILESDIKALKKEDCSKLKQELQQKEEKINDLNKEKSHMLELLNEKEKIINQMAEDSHQLHLNLVTIKSKIKEPGNILDLGNKLREEQRKTAELMQEIHNLKIQLMQCKNNDMTSSVDEIADQLKRELDNSIKIDSNILTAVSDQSLNSISEIQDVEACKKALSRERTNKKQLLQHVHKLQAKITELQNDLEKERAALLKTRTEDAQCIQQLRIQLDIVLDNDETLKKIISQKENENAELEKELDSLKRKNVSSASKSESTEYKKLPTNETIVLNKLRTEHEALLGERNRLSNDLAVLKQTVVETENSCAGTKNLLALEIQRKKNLEDKVQSLQVREKELKEGLMKKSLEMERVVDELSQEKADLIKQKLELLQRLKSQNPFDFHPPPPPSTSNAVPDEFLDKIKELNTALLDNKKLMDLITRISNEKKQVENELEILKGTNKNLNSHLPTTDLIARADYLFAKTLKLESRKKALVFQKRYLMQCILTHKNPVEALPDSAAERNRFKSKLTLKDRFRATVFVVISVIRMKYLVRRWHSGVRIAEKINARHYKPRNRTDVNVPSAQFQVGQPVSNQFFLNPPATNTSTRNMNPFVRVKEETSDGSDAFEDDSNRNEVLMERSVPWSGTTPPSKEKRNKISIGANIFNRQDMNPLKAPQLLAQFVERFDQIQEKLDVVLETNSS